MDVRVGVGVLSSDALQGHLVELVSPDCRLQVTLLIRDPHPEPVIGRFVPCGFEFGVLIEKVCEAGSAF